MTPATHARASLNLYVAAIDYAALQGTGTCWTVPKRRDRGGSNHRHRSPKLVGYEAQTAPEMGWASKRNGELLALAVGHFEIFPHG